MKPTPFGPAEALRRRFIVDPKRDLLDELRAGLEQATSPADREKMRAAAIEAAAEIAAGDSEFLDALTHDVYEAVDGPPPFQVFDPEAIDPVTGAKGRMLDIATLTAEREDFAFVAGAVANAKTALEAREVVQAALQGDHDALHAGAGPEAMTWSMYEALALNALLDDVPDDGTVQAARAREEAEKNAGFADAVKSYMDEMDNPAVSESVLDGEVARADAEVTA